MQATDKELIDLDDIHVWVEAAMYIVEDPMGPGSLREFIRTNWDTSNLTIDITGPLSSVLVIHSKNKSLACCVRYTFNNIDLTPKLILCVWAGPADNGIGIQTVQLYNHQRDV